MRSSPWSCAEPRAPLHVTRGCVRVCGASPSPEPQEWALGPPRPSGGLSSNRSSRLNHDRSAYLACGAPTSRPHGPSGLHPVAHAPATGVTAGTSSTSWRVSASLLGADLLRSMFPTLTISSKRGCGRIRHQGLGVLYVIN